MSIKNIQIFFVEVNLSSLSYQKKGETVFFSSKGKNWIKWKLKIEMAFFI